MEISKLGNRKLCDALAIKHNFPHEKSSNVLQKSRTLNADILDNKSVSSNKKRSFTIGLILPALSESFFATAFSTIESAASNNNYGVIIGQSMESVAREEFLIDMMKERNIDGLIISLSKQTIGYDKLFELRKLNIPIVYFDRIPDNRDIHYVAANLNTGMDSSIDLLVAMGHRKIGLVNGPVALISARERLQIYTERLMDNNLPFNTSYVVDTDLSPDGNYNAIYNILDLPDPPTAIITFNDYVALDCQKAALKLGCKKNQLCFISFSNIPEWAYLDVRPYASIEQFPAEQGRIAFEILSGLMANPLHQNLPDGSYRQVLVDSKMIIL
jgi:DNA-binding LacI/PurR family transcriptional regulator